ncbi:MAG TPA: hypothetical protein VNF29_01210, partial [Candidatus Binataceae bacterium]|nr:hypothetical protein [Candidatus Binataceae bacterium]
TIQAHQDLIERQGAVWLGKFGKKLARAHVLRVNQQCKEGIPTYLYLVKKRSGAYQVHRGTVTSMARVLPRGQAHLVPPYYEERRVLKHIGFWTKVTEIVRLDLYDLRHLEVAASGTDVSYALRHSMAGHFLIREIKRPALTSSLS